MSVIGVLSNPRHTSGIGRRAFDWSRVTWIGEAPDGIAHIHFDRNVPTTMAGLSVPIPDWTAVAVPFDEAVAAWRAWKGETKGRGWWRVAFG